MKNLCNRRKWSLIKYGRNIPCSEESVSRGGKNIDATDAISGISSTSTCGFEISE
jgi:hypothetical protein